MKLEKRSVDIQRLTKPLRREGGEAILNSIAFGGGLKNGGLSNEAMELLTPLCGFDYMGSMEFECGALPEALSRMVEGGSLAAFSIHVVVPESSLGLKDEAKGPCESWVHVICPKEWRDEVTRRIRKFAQGESSDTREVVSLERSIRRRVKGELDPRAVGWIELNNGYMFFLDEDMWRGFCKLFGTEVS